MNRRVAMEPDGICASVTHCYPSSVASLALQEPEPEPCLPDIKGPHRFPQTSPTTLTLPYVRCPALVYPSRLVCPPHAPTLPTTHCASGGMLENTTVMTPSAIIDNAACGAASLCASYRY